MPTPSPTDRDIVDREGNVGVILAPLRRGWRWLRALSRAAWSLLELAAERLGLAPDVDPHTRVTFRAATDAVVPETPDLADELGPEHGPGGLAIDLEDFMIGYIDAGFQFGLPVLGPAGNLPLADPIAHALDLAALALVDRGENESPPDDDRPVRLAEPDESRAAVTAAGTFAKLSRRDRLRAIGLLDEFEFAVRPGADDLLEFDAGLVGQLVVGFTELVYYSEWQGYETFLGPPSQRRHANDSAAVQSWRQTGFPGVADGSASLRGYLGAADSDLGAGDVWTDLDEADGSVAITHDSGTFR
jgi:hypothetical protein